MNIGFLHFVVFLLAFQNANHAIVRDNDDAELLQIYRVALRVDRTASATGQARRLLWAETIEPQNLHILYSLKDKADDLPTDRAIENLKETRHEPLDLRSLGKWPETIAFVSGNDMDQIRKKGSSKHLKKRRQTELIFLSAIGFNPERTVAAVYKESECCKECRRGDLIILRTDGSVWKESKRSSWMT